MKNIKNDSTQGLEIYLNTPIGYKTYWLKPNEIITVPSSYVSDQISLLHVRRLLHVYGA